MGFAAPVHARAPRRARRDAVPRPAQSFPDQGRNGRLPRRPTRPDLACPSAPACAFPSRPGETIVTSSRRAGWCSRRSRWWWRWRAIKSRDCRSSPGRCGRRSFSCTRKRLSELAQPLPRAACSSRAPATRGRRLRWSWPGTTPSGCRAAAPARCRSRWTFCCGAAVPQRWLVMRVVFHRILTVRTPMGRKARPKMISKGAPLIRQKSAGLSAAGVERVGRVTGVRDGRPVLRGRARARGWPTSSGAPDFTADSPGWTCRCSGPTVSRSIARGIVERSPGLYFVGLHFLYSFSSGMIHGVGRDAARIAAAVAACISALPRHKCSRPLAPLSLPDGRPGGRPSEGPVVLEGRTSDPVHRWPPGVVGWGARRRRGTSLAAASGRHWPSRCFVASAAFSSSAVPLGGGPLVSPHSPSPIHSCVLRLSRPRRLFAPLPERPRSHDVPVVPGPRSTPSASIRSATSPIARRWRRDRPHRNGNARGQHGRGPLGRGRQPRLEMRRHRPHHGPRHGVRRLHCRLLPFTTPGSYYIATPGLLDASGKPARSATFQIAADVFRDTLTRAMIGFLRTSALWDGRAHRARQADLVARHLPPAGRFSEISAARHDGHHQAQQEGLARCRRLRQVHHQRRVHGGDAARCLAALPAHAWPP